ncbi:MAG: hypothetical protein JXK05_08000 [Campylobacterales bacterium]|nr:hypothetical protein [Campylobacterales bacterium]
MTFFLRYREQFLKYAYLETVVIMLLYFAVGYAFDPNDLCMVSQKVSFLTIIMALITLFHGLGSGLLASVMLFAAMSLGYDQFDYTFFLKEFVLVLIFGEFHYYWNRTIDQQRTVAEFTETKLFELSKAFYTLKISHDQLEKNYVFKPMSLRHAIRSIKDGVRSGEEHRTFERFLGLLQKNYAIERAFLIHVEKGRSVVARSDAEVRIDLDDLMINEAIEKKMPIYISDHVGTLQSAYLAAIPALYRHEVCLLLVIEKMPFLSFNKDNLISISILLSYLYEELQKVKILEGIADFFPWFQENFRFELYRLSDLNRIYRVHSTVLAFVIDDPLDAHRLQSCVGKNLRSLDVMSHFVNGERTVLCVLFPFADEASAQGFVKRIFELLHVEQGLFRYDMFDLSQLDLLQRYIERYCD